MQSIKADPQIHLASIKKIAGEPVTELTHPGTYKLSVRYGNSHSINDIPPSTARILVGLGMNLVLDPSVPFLPADAFLSFAQRKMAGRQGQINAAIHTALPAEFSGTMEFQVITTGQGISTATVNFLISNNNPDFILMDETFNNNSAAVAYTVK